jgi:ActR/RegA family two-component response regulator
VAAAAAPTVGPSILLVDDEEAILFALQDFLCAAGWRVATAASADGAEELLAASRFAVAVVDLRLSPADDEHAGLEVVRRIRDRSPETRVVVLTAYGSPSVEAEARRLGVDSLLAKPQPLAGLERHLRELATGAGGAAAPPSPATRG